MAGQDKPSGVCQRSISSAMRSLTLWTAALILLVSGCRHSVDNSIQTIRVNAGPIYALSLNSDGRWMAMGTASHDVRVWDVRAGREVVVLGGFESIVRSVAFTPDGTSLFGAGLRIMAEASTIHAWDVASIIPQNGPSVDDARVLHDQNQNRPICTLTPKKQVRALALSASGDSLAVLSGTSVYLYDWTGRRAKERTVFTAFVRDCFDLIFSPNGKQLVVSGTDSPLTEEAVRDRSKPLSAFATASVKTFDSQTGRQISERTPGAESIRAVAFTPDGASLAAGCYSGSQGKVAIWQADRPESSMVSLSVSAPVVTLAISDDGRCMAVAAMCNIEIWDIPSLTRERILRGHKDQVNTVRFLPGGRTLASAGYDGCVKIWEIAKDGSVR